MGNIISEFLLDFIKNVAASNEGEYDRNIITESKEYLKTIDTPPTWYSTDMPRFTAGAYEEALRQLRINNPYLIRPVNINE